MKSFLSGRPRHDEASLPRAVGAEGSALPIVGACHAADARQVRPAAGPSVECVKQGDKVVRMIITCSCGERIEVDCLYPNAG